MNNQLNEAISYVAEEMRQAELEGKDYCLVTADYIYDLPLPIYDALKRFYRLEEIPYNSMFKIRVR